MPTSTKRRLAEGERVNPVLPVHLWQSPATSDTRLVIVTRLDVYAAIHASSMDSLPHETGGFLLGRVACDEQGPYWLLEIDEIMPIEPVEQDVTHFSFSWRDVDRVRRYREERQKALLGWYHSHPDVGIFLSDTDMERTHRLLFSEPFQVALVYDPVRGRAGYFFWEGKQIIDTAEASWREFVIATLPEERAEKAGETAAGTEVQPAVASPIPNAPATQVEPQPPVRRLPDVPTDPSLPPWSPPATATASPDGVEIEVAVADPVAAPLEEPPAQAEDPGKPGPRAKGEPRRLALRLVLLALMTGGVVMAFLALFTMWGR